MREAWLERPSIGHSEVGEASADGVSVNDCHPGAQVGADEGADEGAEEDVATGLDAGSPLALILYCPRWVAARALGRDPLACLLGFARRLDHGPRVAYGFDALFQLAEERLERDLICGCRARPGLTGDEMALRALYALTVQEGGTNA